MRMTKEQADAFKVGVQVEWSTREDGWIVGTVRVGGDELGMCAKNREMVVDGFRRCDLDILELDGRDIAVLRQDAAVRRWPETHIKR